MITTIEQLQEFLKDCDRLVDKLRFICSQFMWGNVDPLDMHYGADGKYWRLDWLEYCDRENVRHFRKVPFDWVLKNQDELSCLIMDILTKEYRKEQKLKEKEQKTKITHTFV